MLAVAIHSGRNRGERAGIGEARSAGTGVYMAVHEDADNIVAALANLRRAEVKRSGRSQRRVTPIPVRAVDLCRYV